MSTYHHGNLPEALLAAAGTTLEKEGPAGLSLRDAARRAKVSHNAPYRHFKDREALLAALAAEGFELLGQAMRGHGGREMGEAYVRFALEHPQRFRLMFGGVLRFADYPQLRAAAQSTYEALKAAMAELPQPDIAAAAAWSLVHGLAHLMLDGHFKGEGQDFARRVLGAVRFAQRAS
jgi:AcrR family transcriptional regulator